MIFLILGGNGYIGSKITRELFNDGHTVVCTKRVNSNLSRVDDLADFIRWIPASIDGIEASMQEIHYDYVLNMVCNYGRTNVLYDGVIEANIEFPLKVLNTIVEHGTDRFLTIGTGLPDEINMYSFAKKIFSEFGKFYVDKHDITFNSLQLEMFYGPDEPKDRFIPSMITKMINGDPVETTLGTQRRDIIAAEDVLKAIKMVIFSDLSGYNEISVGTGVAPTVSELVDYIWQETGRRSEVHKGAIPMREGEPDCVADTALLRRIGEWNPIDWKTGIKDMIKQMEDREDRK